MTHSQSPELVAVEVEAAAVAAAAAAVATAVLVMVPVLLNLAASLAIARGQATGTRRAQSRLSDLGTARARFLPTNMSPSPTSFSPRLQRRGGHGRRGRQHGERRPVCPARRPGGLVQSRAAGRSLPQQHTLAETLMRAVCSSPLTRPGSTAVATLVATVSAVQQPCRGASALSRRAASPRPRRSRQGSAGAARPPELQGGLGP